MPNIYIVNNRNVLNDIIQTVIRCFSIWVDLFMRLKIPKTT